MSKSKRLQFTVTEESEPMIAMAIEKAREIACCRNKETGEPRHKVSRGQALDFICSAFLRGMKEGDLWEHLYGLEDNTGLRVIAYDMNEDEVVFGGELIDELNEKYPDTRVRRTLPKRATQLH